LNQEEEVQQREWEAERVGSVDVIRSFIVFSTAVSSSKKVEETQKGIPLLLISPSVKNER
jgi:hypothetical protein